MKTLLIAVIVTGAVLAVVLFKNKQAIAPENGSVDESLVFCTQDVKLCPDGSYVGRGGPKCEFAPCPTIIPQASQFVKPTSSPKSTQTPTAVPTVSATPRSQTVTITFVNGTAIPSVINIKAGDTVKFINNDSASRWPASGVHPTHQICPGFDSFRGLNTGETYSFTFREAKTCPWHDHLQPSINGQIIVE